MKSRELYTVQEKIIHKKYEEGIYTSEQIRFCNEESDYLCDVAYEHSNKYVSSFICNISFPTTLEELMFYAKEHKQFNVEDILKERVNTWTVPKWAKIGDIVFFMHTKTANSTITRLRTELTNHKDEYSKADYYLLLEWIYRGLKLHALYGGKIFAVGYVAGAPRYISIDDENYEDSELYHWKGNIYADIRCDVLDNPIDISNFNSFIRVARQGSITGVFGEAFCGLKEIVQKSNVIPLYLEDSYAEIMPMNKINTDNWIEISAEYRCRFFLESQFRSYYVDYLLSRIGNQKKIYSECRCKREDIADSYVDNVILFGDKYLPVEVKLYVDENTINQQVSKYCMDDEIIIDRKSNRVIKIDEVYSKRVLVIDSFDVFMYRYENDTLTKIFGLDQLKNDKTVCELKEIIEANLV